MSRDNEVWRIEFKAWKSKVNQHILNRCGMEADDIDDWDYATAFDTCMRPQEAARLAVNEAMVNSGFMV